MLMVNLPSTIASLTTRHEASPLWASETWYTGDPHIVLVFRSKNFHLLVDMNKLFQLLLQVLVHLFEFKNSTGTFVRWLWCNRERHAGSFNIEDTAFFEVAIPYYFKIDRKPRISYLVDLVDHRKIALVLLLKNLVKLLLRDGWWSALVVFDPWKTQESKPLMWHRPHRIHILWKI